MVVHRSCLFGDMDFFVHIYSFILIVILKYKLAITKNFIDASEISPVNFSCQFLLVTLNEISILPATHAHNLATFSISSLVLFFSPHFVFAD